ncbi:MAG: S-methyl-5'-thioinosine phosphorylase [Metallibacterium scheffleri]|jgi:5'-methylthioinosine phosphorylase|uniref:S-methyl-5'-thioinosine phosphorylase n=1 Tax=Metallibacterium scheffleri TaxID=993689 RepID=UPI0026ECA79C|nr:S-methyl-5'-thioinosine phosphorylase [Metallibacterium scheffleri]MCK9365839.1 S-methyl-5'-thioinosine phosphorylase [Metallibacterium scheffleri]
MSAHATTLAIIGGTGLYQLDGLDVESRVPAADTPWGAPSGEVISGRYGARHVLFLARHGAQHTLAPHAVNYRANLWLLQHLGAQGVLGINSVGGIRADLPPCVLALPDQIIDYTWGREGTYGGAQGAPVRHIDFAEPYSASLRARLFAAARTTGVDLREGGCYGCTQGPRLETAAEIARLRRDGCAMVGMTGMPEAALARELGLDYACVAILANWAAGCDPEPHAVTMDEVQANVVAASAALGLLLAQFLQTA